MSMTMAERAELRELFEDLLKPMIERFDAKHNASEKNFETLFKQSEQHFENVKELEDRMNNQIHDCQKTSGHSSEKQGERLEKLTTRVIKLEEKNNNTAQSWTNIFIVVGLIATIALQVLL